MITKNLAIHASFNANLPAVLIAAVIVGGIGYIVHDILEHAPASTAIINSCRTRSDALR